MSDPLEMKLGEVSDWYMQWEIIDVLINGKSSIDLPKLYFKDSKDIELFVKNYGFDPNSPSDLQRMHAMIIEAISFISKQLIPKEWRKGLKPPKDVLLCESPCDLLGWASEEKSERQAWSCAILRVLHTISHIEDVKKIANTNEAQEQILNRFQDYIYRDENGVLWLGEGNQKVELEKIENKRFKTRDSIILKLLHKRANIAETIYDLMGIRIVTKSLVNTMMVVKYLRDFQLVTFPNTHPARARNTLIDAEKFQLQLRSLLELIETNVIDEIDFKKMLSKISVSKDSNLRANPHSSLNYRSIQLTCRQLIRASNPSLSWLDKLNKELESNRLKGEKKKMVKEICELIEGWTNFKQQKTEVLFVPFEVQIMDKEAYLQNQYGAASYDRYKHSQIKTARKRVMGSLIKK